MSKEKYFDLKLAPKFPIGSTNMLIYTHFLYPIPQRKKKLKLKFPQIIWKIETHESYKKPICQNAKKK